MPDTMIERAARALWLTNLLRDASKPDGVQNLTWEDLCLAARSDVVAKVLFDRTRLQARAILTAIREPTEAMAMAGFEAEVAANPDKTRPHHVVPAIWAAMIDAALAEKV